uniref:Uncharacterized protein n=1 Tax=Panagrolaimus sp. ES5 TaxID=591445 RepID=A0AC34F5F9_9BILA
MEDKKSSTPSKIVFLAKPSDWALKLSPHDMHLNEIRMLKDEIKSLRTNNQQLQDICCFLDEDRQKTRQLSKEWQKFGKYTSDLMKQEITAYQQRIQEQQTRHQQLLSENEELKRLCLYLDEQRQAIIAQATAMAEEAAGTQILYGNDADSSDAGCGSSARSSSDSEREYISSKVEKIGQTTTMHLPDPVEFNHEREKALRQLAKTMGNASIEESEVEKIGQTTMHLPDPVEFNHEREKALRQLAKTMGNASIDESEVVVEQNIAHNDRLFNYIQSLESRIKSLEHQNPVGSSSRFSNCSFESTEDLQHEAHHQHPTSRNHSQEPKPIRILSHLSVEDSTPSNTISRQAFCNKMFESTTSTMTSSGTTYCSSETDESAATAVFVMGDEEDQCNHLEVRTLGPIDEETENDSESYSTPSSTISRQAFCNKMFESTTSTMTSSGTTYCSSETDESAATAVFVMGDEEDQCNNLEVRTLGPIDEETENDSESCVETVVKPSKVGVNNHAGNRISSGSEASSSGTSTTAEHADNETEEISSGSEASSSGTSTTAEHADNETEESGIDVGEDLPPKMPLLGETSARLSLCSSNLSLDNCSNSSSSRLSAGTNRSLPEEYCSLGRSKAPPPYSQAQLRHRPSFNAPPHSSFSRPRIIPQHSTLAEAVKSFQSGEDANVLRKLCQNAWDSLERRKNNNNNNSKISHSSSDAHITAV